MNDHLLKALLPGIAAMAASFALLVLLVKLSGAKWEPRRVWTLHRCEHGGVQSLAFVITLPLFLMIVMFIVQISQLMIARIAVEYAAFAAARAAAVWVPARVGSERQNALPHPFRAQNPVLLVYDAQDLQARVGNLQAGNVWSYRNPYAGSSKYRRIFEAAALGCAPIAPSRTILPPGETPNFAVASAVQNFYRAMVPQSVQNPRIPLRLKNKVGYSFENTTVRLAFVDRNSGSGPTYSRRWVCNQRDPQTGECTSGYWKLIPNKVGWTDPMTVTVSHNLALLPGPGRFLAKQIVRADGKPDLVSRRINSSNGRYRERVYSTVVRASATLTNEGFESVIPYVHDAR